MPVAKPNTVSRGQLVVLTGQVEGRCLPLELKGGAASLRPHQLREVVCQYLLLTRLRGVRWHKVP